MHARFAAAVCMRSTHLQRQPRPRHAASFCVLLQPAGLDAYTQLVRRCWAQSQLDRPTFQDIVRELRWAGGLAGWQTDLAGVAESSAFLKMHTLCSLYHVAHPIVCMPRRCRALREAMDYPQAPHPTSPERTAGSAGHSAAFGAGIHPQAKA